MSNLADLDNPLEDQECEAFHQWLEAKNIKHTHISNESGRGRAAMLRTAKMKRLGQSPGFPDYLIILPEKIVHEMHATTVESITFGGVHSSVVHEPVTNAYPARPIAIEMKRRKGGTASPAQKEWIRILNDAGIEATVCRGCNEAIKFVEERL